VSITRIIARTCVEAPPVLPLKRRDASPAGPTGGASLVPSQSHELASSAANKGPVRGGLAGASMSVRLGGPVPPPWLRRGAVSGSNGPSTQPRPGNGTPGQSDGGGLGIHDRFLRLPLLWFLAPPPSFSEILLPSLPSPLYRSIRLYHISPI